MTVQTILLAPPLALVRILAFTFSPALALLGALWYLLSASVVAPFVLLSRFETLYVYCGTAALVGALVGSFAALVAHGLNSLFDLAGTDSASSDVGDVVDPDYMRARRSAAALQKQPVDMGVWAGPRSSLSQTVPTILEEEDEDAGLGGAGYLRKARKRKSKLGEELDTLWPDEDGNLSGDSSF